MTNLAMRGILPVAVLAAMSTPLPTYAETRQVLEEIIVTATRVESSLQDTAIAVSAFNGDTMDDMNIDSPMDYEALVPSLSIQLSPNRTSIRGVGRFGNDLGIAPGVAMYNDGAYLQENTALGTNPLNTERVEIMRGPQGTLFGRNTTGGATNIIKKKPTDVFMFEARANAGNYGNSAVEGIVAGPITDAVGGKFYYNQWWSDGLYDNKSGENTRGKTDGANYYAELILDWQVTDNLYVMYKNEHLQLKSNTGGTAYFTGYDDVNLCTSSLGGWCAQFAQVQAGVDEPLDPWTVDINKVGKVGQDNHLGTTLHVVYDFDNATLRYIGAHNRYDWYSLGSDYDSTSSLEHGQILNIGQDQRITTHEITLNSTGGDALSWIVGAYYLSDENLQPWELLDQGTNPSMATVVSSKILDGNVVTGADWPPPTTDDIVGTNPDLIYYHQTGDFENENWSVFGEFTYAFSDEWALTLGARYSVDDLVGTETQIVYGDSDVYMDPSWYDWCNLYLPNCIQRAAVDFSPTNELGEIQNMRTSKEQYKDSSGRMILEYTPDADNLYWFTISNAFKVGGLRLGNMQNLATGGSPFFDGEEATMYELGWKGTVNDIVQIEAIGFYYDYADMQQLRWYRNEVGISLGNVINVDAEMYGFELQAQWLATDNLMLFATYSYNVAEFAENLMMHEQDIEAHCDEINAFGDCMINLDGKKLDITPDQKLALNALYTINTGIGEIALGGTASYVGERYFDIFNSPELKGDSYVRLDLSATWTSNDGNWGVRAWVKNATDELWYNDKGVGSNSNPGFEGGSRYPATKFLRYSGVPADPRMYAIELQYRVGG